MRTLICSFLLWISTSSFAADILLSRNLKCDEEAKPRAQAICRALEREMQWELFGHAIVSPSFRVTFDSARKTYCRLPIRAEDTGTLVDMVLALGHRAGGMRDVQIENGARWLLFLLGPSALKNFPSPEALSKRQDATAAENLKQEIILNTDDPGMVWNRSNSQYLLRDGCNE